MQETPRNYNNESTDNKRWNDDFFYSSKNICSDAKSIGAHQCKGREYPIDGSMFFVKKSTYTDKCG